jgi:hypothetical protein
MILNIRSKLRDKGPVLGIITSESVVSELRTVGPYALI